VTGIRTQHLEQDRCSESDMVQLVGCVRHSSLILCSTFVSYIHTDRTVLFVANVQHWLVRCQIPISFTHHEQLYP